MHDRRRKSRKHLIFYMEVHESGTQRLLGQLQDISPLGLKLISEDPLEIGHRYRLSVRLPSEHFDETSLDLEAECVWCHPDIRPALYASGFRITRSGARGTLDLETVIETVFEDFVFES